MNILTGSGSYGGGEGKKKRGEKFGRNESWTFRKYRKGPMGIYLSANLLTDTTRTESQDRKIC